MDTVARGIPLDGFPTVRRGRAERIGNDRSVMDGYAAQPGAEVGVGPWVGEHPAGEHWDRDLLQNGDRRNVEDRYRYWTLEAIRADLDTRRSPLHVAVENWGHDFNIGSVIRTANAFNVAAFHIVGRRRWNRRGAMVTDRYQHEHHHASAADLAQWAGERGLVLLGVDNLPGSLPIETYAVPRECVLVFGQEGPGLSPEMQEVCADIVHITQYGSTRSINAGAAAAIAMYDWARRHLPPPG
jgi:tRNA G18 (ribose-2'-O)-methylase SpoU